jgi:hypothetical protein
VTNFARSLAQLAGLHSRRALSVLALSLTGGACLLAAAPAQAIVEEVGGTSVGVAPRMGNTIVDNGGPGFANENGNAVLHGTNVYPVYWDPEDTFFDHHEWMTLVNTFFQRVGAASGSPENIFGALGQYRDRSNQGAQYHTVLKGPYTDFKAYPTAGCTDPNPLEVGSVTCLTDAQLRTELQSFVASHGLPKGMNTVYYVILPPGVTLCLDAAATHCSDFTASEAEQEEETRQSTSYKHSFCSYHGDINPDNATEGDGNTILYGAIPWTAGTLGLSDFAAVPSASSLRYPGLSGSYYQQGFDCQDGGWGLEENLVKFEQPPSPSKEEAEILNEEGTHTAGERVKLERKRYLEGPHQEEPNQEGLGEAGDFGPALADLTVNQIAIQQADIVTDPILNAWQDSSHREVADECRDFFGSTINEHSGGSLVADEHTEAGTLFNTEIDGGEYYINNVFSLSKHRCVGGVGFVPRFTSPDPVNAGEIVGFDGMESTVALIEGLAFGPSGPPTKTYATFNWNFGDGAEASGFAPGSPPCEAPWLAPCAGSVYHTYTYGGTYKVTLTITDVAGGVDNVTHEVTVAGPSAPGTPGAAGPGAAAGPGTTGSGTGSSPGSGKGAAAQPGKPVATATFVSRSLKTAVKKGVAVAYSVNEQVTGRFEVLISKSLAKKLHISGKAATGLPAGTPPQLVIGKAILVTTKGGHSVEHVMLSKSASSRLRHAHKAPLMLRLIVRNAGTTPQSTTVISAATLVG